jgi:hypothetical protein
MPRWASNEDRICHPSQHLRFGEWKRHATLGRAEEKVPRSNAVHSAGRAWAAGATQTSINRTLAAVWKDVLRTCSSPSQASLAAWGVCLGCLLEVSCFHPHSKIQEHVVQDQ